jgi:hypothetical protein
MPSQAGAHGPPDFLNTQDPDNFLFGEASGDAHAIELPTQAVLHGASHASAAAADVPADQFHFADLNAAHDDSIVTPSQPDAHPAVLQALIEATTPPDHFLSMPAIDAAIITSVDTTSSNAHQGAVHAHGGVVV